jgi:hypothetical protein
LVGKGFPIGPRAEETDPALPVLQPIAGVAWAPGSCCILGLMQLRRGPRAGGNSSPLRCGQGRSPFQACNPRDLLVQWSPRKLPLPLYQLPGSGLFAETSTTDGLPLLMHILRGTFPFLGVFCWKTPYSKAGPSLPMGSHVAFSFQGSRETGLL